MIHVDVDGKQIAIPGDVLAREVLQAMPAWLFMPTANGQQALVKSGIKGILPMLLTFIHREIVSKGSTFPTPNLKSAAAKADILTYAVNYLIGSFAAAADGDRFVAQGLAQDDGSFLVTGFTTPAPIVDGTQSQATASPRGTPALADSAPED